MIKRDNYEIFFIDYFDGKLNKSQQAELFSFLENNIDLKEEFNNFSGITVEPNLSVEFSNKDSLKKDSINTTNYKTWFVAFIEGDLSMEMKKELEYFLLKNPGLKKELEILKQTKLFPDHRIIFTGKNKLRKGGKVILFNPVIKKAISIAAILILLVLMYFILHPLQSPELKVADKKEIEKKKIENPNPEVKGKDNSQDKLKKQSPAEAPVNRLKKEPAQFAEQNKNRRVNKNPLKLNTATPAPDTNHPEKALESPVLASKNKNADTLSEKPVIQLQVANNNSSKEPVIPQMKLSDVFTDEDLKEMGNDNGKAEKKEESKKESLLEFASKEVKKISNSTNISFETSNNSGPNSITYALAVGKNFSISHTTQK